MRSSSSSAALVLVLGGLWSAAGTVAPPAAALESPPGITNVSAVPGPYPGQVTISWEHDGAATTSYQIETAASSFSPTKASMALHGRHSQLFTLPASLRSVTLSAAQVARSGASAASGNLLYYRVYAVNESRDVTRIKRHPYLKAVQPAPEPPKEAGSPLRAATFNVRTAKATSDPRPWLTRVHDVAAAIKSSAPGVVTLQELGPGRADGKGGSTKGSVRQTQSLEDALQALGRARYQLTRVTPFVKSGTATGSQGARILYDTTRYQLLSDCDETTEGSSYSADCTIEMPLLPGRPEGDRRRAVYAKLQDRATGQKFYVTSVHLDSDHSSTVSRELAYEAHRGAQVQAVMDAIAEMNDDDLPVVLGGDLNGWQNNKVADDAHETLAAGGYYDSSSALERVNMEYATVNHFDTTVHPNPTGVGARLDVVTVWGGTGALRIENVVKPVDPERASDHNLVVSDVVL